MNADQFYQKLLTDIKVELADEFDRNIERKGFFSQPWQERKKPDKGTLMVKTGALRRSIRAEVIENGVKFTSSLPYANIHNEGGTIRVTPKMKRFFWARYYELSGKVKTKKDGTKSQSKTSTRFSDEAEFYKNMALMKVGSKITIPQRKFIGDAPEVQATINHIVDSGTKDLDNHLKLILKPK